MQSPKIKPNPQAHLGNTRFYIQVTKTIPSVQPGSAAIKTLFLVFKFHWWKV